MLRCLYDQVPARRRHFWTLFPVAIVLPLASYAVKQPWLFLVQSWADLARVAAERGNSVGLCCFSSRVKVWHDAKAKREHLPRNLDTLAMVRADSAATNYHEPINLFLSRVKRRSLCLFLTTLSESESTWQLMRRPLRLRSTHAPAVISQTDPELHRALRRVPRDFEDACRKLAAANGVAW